MALNKFVQFQINKINEILKNFALNLRILERKIYSFLYLLNKESHFFILTIDEVIYSQKITSD